MTEGTGDLTVGRSRLLRRTRDSAMDPPQGLAIRPAVVVVIFLEFAASMIFWLMWSSGSDPSGFAAVGLLIAVMTQFPFIFLRHELFSIWGMVALAVTIGSGIRGIFIAVGYPSRDFVDSFFLGGATFEGMFGPSMIALGSVGLASVGYMFGARPRRPKSTAAATQAAEADGSAPKAPGKDSQPSSRTWLLHDRVPEGFVVALATLYAGIGTLAMIAYTRGVGGLGGSISQRRGTVSADGSTSGTFGYYEFLAEASTIAAMILLAYWLATRKRLGLLRMLILGAFFIDALALNWVTTTRSDVVYLAATVFAVVQIVRRRVSWLGIVAAGLAVLLAIGMLTASRSSSQDDGNGFSIQYGLNSGLLNRNGYDLGKTIRVVQAVPDVLPYQNGATIGVFALAPIPRSMWPGKPIISPGRDIGTILYGTTQSGVPPGMTGELVWNWGSTIALIASLAIGFALGWLERRFRPTDPSRTAMVVFYAVVLFTLGKNVFGVSIGQAVITAIEGMLLLVPAALLTRMATAGRAARTARSNKGRAGKRRPAVPSAYRSQ